MSQVRRQEFVVSLAEHDAHLDKILAKNEFLYVRQEDGKLKLKCGDGNTPLSGLEYSIDIGVAELAAENAQIARTGAETARDEAEQYAEALGNVYNKNETDVLLNLKANKLVDYEQGNILISDDTGNISDSGYHINVLNDNYKRYGVSGVGGMNPTLTRLWNSVGLTANAGTDTTAPINDFDDLPPFNRKKCVGYWIDGGGKAKFIVQAYEGDPDFAEDGTKGDYVAVEVSPFWYYQDDFSQHNPEQISGTLGVSPTPVPGWQPHKICLNDDGSIRQKTYLPCYALAQKDGKAVSLPGLENVFGHYKGLWDIARTYGDVEAAKHAILEPIHVRHYEWLLFTIEYATTNCQSVMNGAVALPYSNSTIYQATVATIGETDNNKFILPNSGAAPYVVGQVLAMGAAAYDETHKRIIVAIEDYDADNKTLVFDGEALDIPVGYWSNSRPYRTGTCNTVLTPTGSPVSNTNGKYPMRYRYRENIWGNQYSTCGDLIAKRIGDGTEENPYYVEWYYLIDKSYYPSATSKPDEIDLDTGAWVKQQQRSEYVDGYIKQIAMDSRYPHVMTPIISTGAGSTTYFCDRVYLVNTPIVRAVRLGGSLNSGASAGVLLFLARHAPSSSPWHFGGGLYFLQ
ncbi:MAG: hypothetical protein PHV07_04250 [Oscillospiraceae bacterium]|nr:hypothetical protein [Oscillospiraceae bacterium]